MMLLTVIAAPDFYDYSYLIASKIQTVDITIAMRFPSASAVRSANWEMLMLMLIS